MIVLTLFSIIETESFAVRLCPRSAAIDQTTAVVMFEMVRARRRLRAISPKRRRFLRTPKTERKYHASKTLKLTGKRSLNFEYYV